MRVGILGASGFVGGYLRAALELRNDEVVAATLRDPEAAARQTSACDVVINLAGEPIAQRWDDDVKHRIVESRVEGPRRYLAALAAQGRHPSAYVSASAIGYYGTSDDATFTERSGPGSDFLAGACVAWEREAARAGELGMRVAIVRTGIALATDGGVLEKLLLPFRLGVGGKIGSGKQWMSWIHVADLIGVYILAIDGAEGPLNATAPHPVTNAEFTTALGRALARPTFLPTPIFALRALLGEGADVALRGQRVLPERTEASGFSFAYPTLQGALETLLSRRPEHT